MKVEKHRIENPDKGANGEGMLHGSPAKQEDGAEPRESNLLKLPPLTSPNDSNVDPWTLDALLQQSYHLISMLRMSMSSWIISSEVSRSRKIRVTKRYEIPTVAVEMPLEITLSKSRLQEYMELCVGFGMTSLEYWNGHPDAVLTPREVVKLAAEYELDVLARVGLKRGSEGDRRRNGKLINESKEWLDAGAKYLVAEPFETYVKILPQKSARKLSKSLSEHLAVSFGLHSIMFDAPVKETQMLLIDHFGPEVRLCAVRLEEILEIESYRRQPYSGFFGGPKRLAFLSELEKGQYLQLPGNDDVSKTIDEPTDLTHITGS